MGLRIKKGQMYVAAGARKPYKEVQVREEFANVGSRRSGVSPDPGAGEQSSPSPEPGLRRPGTRVEGGQRAHGPWVCTQAQREIF